METKPQNPPDVKAGGWFKVWRKDRSRIIEQCEGTTLAALSVWDALCDIANEKRSATFDASIGVIRSRAGTSRSTTFKAIDLLEQLGMVRRKQNAIPGKKNALNVSTYELLTQSVKDTTPPSAKKTTPSPSKQGNCSDRGFKTRPIRAQEDKESAPSACGSALVAQPQPGAVTPFTAVGDWGKP